MVEGKNWPHGIVGLVAGKLMEKYSRPVIILNEEETEFKGSARSVDGFNLVGALEESQEYLSKFGGHAKAAGLSLEKQHLSLLYDKLLEIAESKIKFEDMVPNIHIDMEIEDSDININLIKDLDKFEPFGLGNPRPVFMVKKFKIINKRAIGANGKHLKLTLEKNGNSFDSIGFDLGNLYDKLNLHDSIDAVFSIEINEWNNTKKIQLKLQDVKNG